MGGAHIGDGYESIGWPIVAYSGLFLAYSAASWADDLPTSVLLEPVIHSYTSRTYMQFLGLKSLPARLVRPVKNKVAQTNRELRASLEVHNRL